MNFTLKIESMAETLNRTNIRYPSAPILLHALFSEWEGFLKTEEATEDENPLSYIYEELDWLLENDKDALTVDEYIVLRHVAYETARERGW